MRERPILFSAPMVRAILEDRKTQTRRVAKLAQQIAENHERVRVRRNHNRFVMSRDAMYTPEERESFWLDCPYGVRGDRLWVKETFRLGDGMNPQNDPNLPTYAADWPESREFVKPWKPSIFMPRKFSRITLEITGVRIQRVQEISEEDAIAEGIRIFGATPVEILTGLMAGMGPMSRRAFLASAIALSLSVADVMMGRRALTNREAYAILWDRINAKRGYGWDVNPWVWAVTFRRLA